MKAPKPNVASPVYHAAALILIAAGVALAPIISLGATDHPPTISWIGDQRISSGKFVTQYVRIKDYDNDAFTLSWQSSNTNFFPHNMQYMKITPCSGGACPADGGYQITFPNPFQATGLPVETTITVIVTETSNPSVMAEASFTLQLDSSGGHPPVMGMLPNRAVQIDNTTGYATYQTMFVIGDQYDNSTSEDVSAIDAICDHFQCNPDGCYFEATSSNTSVIGNSADGSVTFQLITPPGGFTFGEGPRSYLITATSKYHGNPDLLP